MKKPILTEVFVIKEATPAVPPMGKPLDDADPNRGSMIDITRQNPDSDFS